MFLLQEKSISINGDKILRVTNSQYIDVELIESVEAIHI